MKDELYYTQVNLEKDMKQRSVSRFLSDHETNDLTGTLTGNLLTTRYLTPITEALVAFLEGAQTGKAGRKNLAPKCLSQLPPDVVAYISVKIILDSVLLYGREGAARTMTSLAISIGNHLHDELRIRKFEAEHQQWLERMWSNFNKRELPRYKRKEYLQKTVNEAGEEWSVWSKSDMVHVSVKMADLFMHATGDMRIRSSKKGRHKIDLIEPNEGALKACERIGEDYSDLTRFGTRWCIPPAPWSAENLTRGGYRPCLCMPTNWDTLHLAKVKTTLLTWGSRPTPDNGHIAVSAVERP